MTIEQIEEALRTGQIPPHDLATMRAFLASAYSYHAGQLEEVLTKKPGEWNILRQAQKSDKATDRAWEATPSGLAEMKLRITLKRCEKLSSATKSLLQVAEGEARNHY